MEHVKKMLERLRKYQLHAKLEKCDFHTQRIGFVGFVVTHQGISMEKIG